MKEKSAKDEEKPAAAPIYCISSPGDVECETIHVIDESGAYAKLSDELEAINEEYVKNAPDEWIMRIPESYSSESYFDYDDDGTIDSIYWYPDASYPDGEYLESGMGVKYNGRYFESSEICPADEMPWSHYRVYLMHKDNQTVLVKHHYEEAESIWDSFSLANDFVESVDRVYAYPEYENYSQQESGWLVPTDMTAIRVYSDHGGDEMTEYPDEILTVAADGRMKVSELSGKDRKSSEGSSDGSKKQNADHEG